VADNGPGDQTFAEDIDRRRDRLARLLPRHYHPTIYFGASNLMAAIAIFAALAQLHEVRAWEWLIVPAAFLVANWVEYRVHKGPMHHKRRPWEILFERHTRQHHVYFDHANMSARNAREYYWVFFPWWAVGMVVVTAALFALPIGLFASHNLGLLFFAVGIAYYLIYEWLHFSYHLPVQSGIGRMATVQRLRRLHAAHHDTALMTTQNFNITFPICDWLFGTLSSTRIAAQSGESAAAAAFPDVARRPVQCSVTPNSTHSPATPDANPP
jgi:hypothetical protein